MDNNDKDTRPLPVSQEEVKGLPVAGYKLTQPPIAIAAVNVFKELEERTLRHIDVLMGERTGPTYVSDADKRMLAVGRTQLQLAFMALNRAIFQPQRVALPEDAYPHKDLFSDGDHDQGAQ